MRNSLTIIAVTLFLVSLSTGCVARAGGGVRIDPAFAPAFAAPLSVSSGVPVYGSSYAPGAVQVPPPVMPPGINTSDLFIGAPPTGTVYGSPLVKRIHVENPTGYMVVEVNGAFPEIRAGNGQPIPRQIVTIGNSQRQVALLGPGGVDLYILARPGSHTVAMHCIDPTVGEFGYTQKKMNVPDIGLGVNLWWTECQASAMRPR